MAPYRPPGRSNRSGRTNADNDVFEGLPVKQWGQSVARISLAPPTTENPEGPDDKWGEPPMPRDSGLLHPWTQYLLRMARSGKVGAKRKSDPDSMDEDKPDDDANEEVKHNLEDRGYMARKWKPIAEAHLTPEHRHFEYLAKRRKGLPSMYGGEVQNGAIVTMRKTKVQKAGPDGEVAVYEVLVPEGQTVEGEVTESTELADVKPVAAAPGTVIEGVGIANDEGVVVAEHLKPTATSRRNRPPPKKKGGPGRGKKRVTFTNPDGSTYTTIVPNATKIVPQPGQIVKHVAKGEQATADVSAEEAAKHVTTHEGQTEDGEVEGDGEGEGEGDDGEGSDDDGDEGDEDDDREEGELSDEDAPSAEGVTPAPANPAPVGDETEVMQAAEVKAELTIEDAPKDLKPVDEREEQVQTEATAPIKERDISSSPELPLAKDVHSRQGSLVSPTTNQNADEPDHPDAPVAAPTEDLEVKQPDEEEPGGDVPMTDEPGLAPESAIEPANEPTNETEPQTEPEPEIQSERPEAHKSEEGEDDLLGNLEKHLES